MSFLSEQQIFQAKLRATLNPINGKVTCRPTVTRLEVQHNGIYQVRYYSDQPFKFSTFDKIDEKNIIEIDFTSKDKEYWLRIFNEIKTQHPVEQNKLIQQVKELCHQIRTRPKELSEIFPFFIISWAYEMINQRDLDCVDNIRIAKIGNSSQKRRYRKQQKSGCCGFMDVIREAPDGQRYMVGCNYGH